MARLTESRETLERRKQELLEESKTLKAATAENERRLRLLDREDRVKRQAVVGKLADEAGLLAYDLGALEKAFARLAETLGEGR